MNIADVLRQAASYRQAGHWTDAENLYRQVLEAEPKNLDALVALGTLALEHEQPGRAVELLDEAVRLDDSHASWHTALAEAHRQTGNLAQAALCNQKALQLNPQSAVAHAGLAAIEYQQDNLTAAAEHFQTVVRIDPDSPWAHAGYGQVLLDQNRLAEAEARFRRAVELVPRDRGAREGLAMALARQAKHDEARAAFEAVVQLAPNDAGAHTNLGNLLKQMGLLVEAEARHRDALALDPMSPIALNNLGATLAELDRHEEAIETLAKSARQQPEFSRPFRNLARSFFELGRIDEAVAAARHAVALAPHDVVAHSVLAVGLRSLGRIDEAISAHRHVVAMAAADACEGSNLLYTLGFHPTFDPAALAAEHRDWALRHADPITEQSKPCPPDATSQRRLRIGYVSAYFREHAVNFFVEPILASHDRGAFEVFCYSNCRQRDRATARLQSCADHWRDIAGESDDAASQLVRRDEIDILVDLSGHIPGNRLLVFARRPAPVQVTYLGYHTTTGMAAMGYRVTDDWADPPGTTDEFYTEKLVRLPRSFFCYQPSADAPDVNRPPALDNGYVTFGSFNYFAKITPDVLATWARLLHAVPRSRLVILPHTARSLRQYLADTFAAHGVGSDRWSLIDRRPRRDYLELIRTVDIALDAFPFNGHTTTCDALWQGVPVVTLAGGRYCSRFGSSAHVNLGLQNLIARSGEEYVEIAARLAGDPDRIAELRAGLRERMKSSPLLDFAGFTRELEAAYRRMWADACSGSSNC